MNKNVIETRNLTKMYGDFVAVDGLNLDIREGEVFGILGPNGSGKTTTILMLLGLTEPTSGDVSVLGLNPARQPLSVKSHVGYMPDQIGFYDELTARENLIYIAKLNGLRRADAYKRIDESLERLGLTEVANNRVGTYSRGMRQRLGVADVMIKQPKVIIMDEPTQGLDPEHVIEFLDMVRDLKKDGITIILSSHLLHQVQVICDRVGLYHKGKVVLEGTVPELARKVLTGAYHIHLQAGGDPKKIINALDRLTDTVNVNRLEDDQYMIEVNKDMRPEVAEAVVGAGGKLMSMDIETQSLDAIYARYFQEIKDDNEG